MNFKDVFILNACGYKTKNNCIYCDYRYVENNKLYDETNNYFVN